MSRYASLLRMGMLVTIYEQAKVIFYFDSGIYYLQEVLALLAALCCPNCIYLFSWKKFKGNGPSVSVGIVESLC